MPFNPHSALVFLNGTMKPGARNACRLVRQAGQALGIYGYQGMLAMVLIRTAESVIATIAA